MGSANGIPRAFNAFSRCDLLFPMGCMYAIVHDDEVTATAPFFALFDLGKKAERALIPSLDIWCVRSCRLHDGAQSSGAGAPHLRTWDTQKTA